MVLGPNLVLSSLEKHKKNAATKGVFQRIHHSLWGSEQFFHFLPSFLSVIPVPNEDDDIIEKVSHTVQKIQ